MERMRIGLVGATGVGKTGLALELARAEPRLALFSCDSMAVYRGMDLGTAKPDSKELGAITYRLVDLADPGQEFSVADYQRAAGSAENVLAAGQVPLYVGGTGLYFSAVFDRLAIPPSDPMVREGIANELGAVGAAEMHRRLAEVDPLAASRIEPGNVRRIVRALEVIAITGRRFSSFGPGLAAYREPGGLLFGLQMEFELLDARIEARVSELLGRGWLAECERLLAAGPLSRTAAQAIGYHELFSVLRGEAILDQVVPVIVARTRRLARRQRSWFRRDPRIVWHEDPAELGAALLQVVGE